MLTAASIDEEKRSAVRADTGLCIRTGVLGEPGADPRRGYAPPFPGDPGANAVGVTSLLHGRHMGSLGTTAVSPDRGADGAVRPPAQGASLGRDLQRRFQQHSP